MAHARKPLGKIPISVRKIPEPGQCRGRTSRWSRQRAKSGVCKNTMAARSLGSGTISFGLVHTRTDLHGDLIRKRYRSTCFTRSADRGSSSRLMPKMRGGHRSQRVGAGLEFSKANSSVHRGRAQVARAGIVESHRYRRVCPASEGRRSTSRNLLPRTRKSGKTYRLLAEAWSRRTASPSRSWCCAQRKPRAYTAAEQG